MNLDTQTIVAALIVVPSTGYAAWSVMPVSWRAGLARGALRAAMPWPASTKAWLLKAAAGRAGCGCNGCDHAKPATASAGRRVIPIQPRGDR